jgi:hypothetical protein
MKVKLVVDGAVKDDIVIPARVETIVISETPYAYLTVFYAALLVLFAVGLPFILARAILR